MNEVNAAEKTVCADIVNNFGGDNDMKKLICTLLSLTLVLSLVSSVGAASVNVPMFKVDGKLFVTPKGEPSPYINRDNRTMGSLRLLGNALGVPSTGLKWDQKQQVATLSKDGNTVSVTVGKKVISVNGKNVTMDTVAELKQGRVFIPARFIAQGLGVKISFESVNNTVHFTTGTGKVAKHNFEDKGLTPVVELPLVLKHNGLQLTVHEAYVYSTKDAEALALHGKYDLWRFDEAFYLVWVKVTIENTSKKLKTTDYRDMLKKVSAMNGLGNSLHYSASWKESGAFLNNTELLVQWVLEPGESVTSYIPFLDLENKDLDFVGIGIGDGTGSDYSRLAERK